MGLSPLFNLGTVKYLEYKLMLFYCDGTGSMASFRRSFPTLAGRVSESGLRWIPRMENHLLIWMHTCPVWWKGSICPLLWTHRQTGMGEDEGGWRGCVGAGLQRDKGIKHPASSVAGVWGLVVRMWQVGIWVFPKEDSLGFCNEQDLQGWSGDIWD